MGELVAGLFSTHVPRLMIHDPIARKNYMRDNVTTFYDVLPQIRHDLLNQLEFDTFVILDTHWHSTTEWIVNGQNRLQGIYTSDELPWMIHEYEYDYPGDPELARAIGAACKAASVWVDVCAYRGLPVHYGTLNPMHYYNPGPNQKRVCTMSVCDTAEVDAHLAFGEAVARGIAASDRKVVFIASGGMSHRFWPLSVIREHASADPRDINGENLRAWDERIMAWWRAGDHRSVIENAEQFRRECSPEGRFGHYLALAGAMGGAAWDTPGVQYGAYEAAIGTGQVNYWFPGAGASVARGVSLAGAAAR
jgi:3,4-dihydroxyphenylacetate 2,3-dioxygenase